MIRCNLARILKEQNLTIRDLECDLGVPSKYFKQMMEDKCDSIQLEILNKMCDYLGRTTSQIFEYFPEDIIKDITPDSLLAENSFYVYVGKNTLLTRDQWLKYPMYPKKYKKVESHLNRHQYD